MTVEVPVLQEIKTKMISPIRTLIWFEAQYDVEFCIVGKLLAWVKFRFVETNTIIEAKRSKHRL